MKLTVHPIRATPGRTRPSPFNTPPAGVCLLLSLPQSAADDFIPLTQASCARSGSGIAASVSRALEVCEAGAHTGSPRTAHSRHRFSPCLSACLSFYHLHTFAVMILRLVFQAVTQTERGQIWVKVTRPQGQNWPLTRTFPTAEVSESIRSTSPDVFWIPEWPSVPADALNHWAESRCCNSTAYVQGKRFYALLLPPAGKFVNDGASLRCIYFLLKDLLQAWEYVDGFTMSYLNSILKILKNKPQQQAYFFKWRPILKKTKNKY